MDVIVKMGILRIIIKKMRKGNFRIFVDFPDMYYCYTSLVDDDRWRDAKEYLCPGFKYNNYNEETMIPKHNIMVLWMEMVVEMGM